ncbi:YpdA family putative bacillithiol disulfide reductase [bacterium]|nr:YpdA family putative bacillithiol disulfide reductase [bacterium]
MRQEYEVQDVIIIGAGPGGLACAIEAQKQQLNYLVIEKGCLVNSIYRFPTNVTFFSTPELLEIGGIPFIIPGEKPSKSDLLNYYRSITEHFDLNIRSFEAVTSVSAVQEGFVVTTEAGSEYQAQYVVVAMGQFDNPNFLRIAGEELDKVSHYYTDAHPFYKKNVAIIGGKNSAVEAALELYRHGANVTVIHRGEAFGKSVKYWILPDIENRIAEGKIRAFFETAVEKITRTEIHLSTAGGRRVIDNDFVFALTGYRPDLPFLRKIGIEIDATGTPVHNPDTLETNVPGIYVAGVITAGCRGSKVFIENSRDHGKKIVRHILNGQ